MTIRVLKEHTAFSFRIFYAEDGGNVFLQNFDTSLSGYMAS
jgi:hypothetical protein